MAEPSLVGLFDCQILTSELLSFLHPPQIDSWEIVATYLRDVCRLASTCSAIRQGMNHRLEVTSVDLRLLRMSPTTCNSLLDLCHPHHLASLRGIPLFTDYNNVRPTPLSEERGSFWKKLVERLASEFTELELFEPTLCRGMGRGKPIMAALAETFSSDSNLFNSIPNPSLLNGLTQALRRHPTLFRRLRLLNLSGYDCPRNDALDLLKELQNVQTLRIFVACELMTELSDEEILELTIDSFPHLMGLHVRRCKRTEAFVCKLAHSVESRITEFNSALNRTEKVLLKEIPHMNQSSFIAALLNFQRVFHNSPAHGAVGNFIEQEYSTPDSPLLNSVELFLEQRQIFNSFDGSRIVYPRLQLVQLKDFWQQGPCVVGKARAQACSDQTRALELKRRDAIVAILATSWGRELKERLYGDQIFYDSLPHVSFIDEAGRSHGVARSQFAKALGFSLDSERS